MISAPSGREVALEHDDAAARMQRRGGAADDLAVGRRLPGQGLGQRPARQRQAVAVQVAAIEQRLQHRGDAADPVQVDGEVLAAGLQVADQRRAREDVGDVVEREADAGLVGDRRQVQAGVGGAAGRGHGGAGVLECLARHQIARQRAAVAQDLGGAAAGAARQREALHVDRRHHRRARQRQAERLRHHRHRVGGELARARSQRRRAVVSRARRVRLRSSRPASTVPTLS